MQRTQISLTDEDRRLLDAESARTGRSLSALIRAAVGQVYGEGRSVEDDLRLLDEAFGGWAATQESRTDGAGYVDRLRSGRRLSHPNR